MNATAASIATDHPSRPGACDPVYVWVRTMITIGQQPASTKAATADHRAAVESTWPTC